MKRRVFVVEPGAFSSTGNLSHSSLLPSVRPVGPRRPLARSVSRPPLLEGQGSRIWVEGTHDAELVEKVWGEDLRGEAIVVEPLHGADGLVDALREFAPSPHRRVGVLLDHMVDRSKEARIAQDAMAAFAPNRPRDRSSFVDIWQAVKPEAVGIPAWPTIPRATMEGRCHRGTRLEVRRTDSLEADPAQRLELHRPRTELARPSRGAHRFRHRRMTVRDSEHPSVSR